jgi:hypothetical protein
MASYKEGPREKATVSLGGGKRLFIANIAPFSRLGSSWGAEGGGMKFRKEFF